MPRPKATDTSQTETTSTPDTTEATSASDAVASAPEVTEQAAPTEEVPESDAPIAAQEPEPATTEIGTGEADPTPAPTETTEVIPEPTTETADTDQPPATHKHKLRLPSRPHITKRRALVFGISLTLCALFVGSSLWFFSNHALPASYINNHNVSFKSYHQIEQTISSTVSTYSITISGAPDDHKDPSLETLGVTIKASDTVTNFKNSQRGFRAFISPWHKKQTAIAYDFDNTKANSYVDSIKQVIDQKSADASIEVSDGKVRIVPEIAAKVSGIPNAAQQIRASLSTMQPLTLKVETYEELPPVTAAALESSKVKVEQVVNTPITLTFNGYDLSPSRAEVGGWVTIKTEPDKPATITLEESAVTAYIDTAIKPYISPPRPRIVTQDATTGETRELAAGADGVDVTDKSKTIADIISNMTDAKPVNVTLTTTYAARKTIEAGDYDKWIEVDISNKRTYAYEHGTLVRTFLVTAGAPETPTVVGQYKIYTKVRSQTMRGLNTDGTYYNVPNVQWVSYFYQDYAIHGNYWRPAEVFGNTNTSHGCVSLVNTESQWIYNWAPIGTTVLTHL